MDAVDAQRLVTDQTPAAAAESDPTLRAQLRAEAERLAGDEEDRAVAAPVLRDMAELRQGEPASSRP